MDEIRQQMAQMAASIQVLGANTSANTKDLMANAVDQHEAAKMLVALTARAEGMATRMEQMAERNRQTEEIVARLQGTFASIETHMIKLFELEAENKKRLDGVEARLQRLEQKPPAA